MCMRLYTLPSLYEIVRLARLIIKGKIRTIINFVFVLILWLILTFSFGLHILKMAKLLFIALH